MDVVCLWETKWRSYSNKITRSLIPNRFVNWAASCSKGAYGVIVIMWDSRVLQLVGFEESCHTLSCRFSNCGPSPFHFANMWLKLEGFHNLIDGWWKSFVFRGTNSFLLMEKLKALKCKLKG